MRYGAESAAGARSERHLRTDGSHSRRELSGRLPIVSEQHLHQALREYLRHHNTARHHLALGQLGPAQTDARHPRSTPPSTGSAENVTDPIEYPFA